MSVEYYTTDSSATCPPQHCWYLAYYYCFPWTNEYLVQWQIVYLCTVVDSYQFGLVRSYPEDPSPPVSRPLTCLPPTHRPPTVPPTPPTTSLLFPLSLASPWAFCIPGLPSLPWRLECHLFCISQQNRSLHQVSCCGQTKRVPMESATPITALVLSPHFLTFSQHFTKKNKNQKPKKKTLDIYNIIHICNSVLWD